MSSNNSKVTKIKHLTFPSAKKEADNQVEDQYQSNNQILDLDNNNLPSKIEDSFSFKKNSKTNFGRDINRLSRDSENNLEAKNIDIQVENFGNPNQLDYSQNNLENSPENNSGLSLSNFSFWKKYKDSDRLTSDNFHNKILPSEEMVENSTSSNHVNKNTQSIQRVFRKSVIFLIISLCVMAVTIFLSLNVFFLGDNLLKTSLITLGFTILSVSLSNLFFIILADRSYLLLYLLGQFILLIFANSFVGLGFSLATLSISILSVLTSYFAYSELEKLQLGSRLFNIANITAETTRILLSAFALIISLSVFNQIIFKGTVDNTYVDSSSFFEQAFFSKDWFVENLAIGFQSNLGLNKILMNGDYFIQEDGLTYTYDTNFDIKVATFREFLTDNYEASKTLISTRELEDIQDNCLQQELSNCDRQVQLFKDERLNQWKDKSYSELGFGLDTELDRQKFFLVTQKYYSNLIKDLSNEENQDSSLLPENINIPFSYILPLIFTFIVYIVLLLIRPILSFLTTILTSIIWFILKKLSFVYVDVETVEAEIVSI